LLENPNNEIYLVQRPPAGIWGGLWCLPELTKNNAQEWELESLPVTQVAKEAYVTGRHTFSHFHLDYSIIRAKVESNQMDIIMEQAPAVWYNPANPPEVGLAAPIKKLLHSVEV
jgi:A/G-specific adenine glycosylase